MVAMMNKNLIHSTVCLPIVGETNFFSKSLRFNLELIFFRKCFRKCRFCALIYSIHLWLHRWTMVGVWEQLAFEGTIQTTDTSNGIIATPLEIHFIRWSHQFVFVAGDVSICGNILPIQLRWCECILIQEPEIVKKSSLYVIDCTIIIFVCSWWSGIRVF